MMVSVHGTKIVSKHLVDSGGGITLAVDGTAPKVFSYTVPTGNVLELASCAIGIVDGSINPRDFGGINGGLTAGLLVKLHDTDEAVLFDFLDGDPIKRNSGFSKLSNARIDYETGAGDDVLQVYWNLTAGYGTTLRLDGGESLRVTVRDDLTSLVDFWWYLKGVLYY